MNRKYFVLGSILILFIAFCSCTVTQYTYKSQFSDELSVEDVVAASVSVLTQNGFTIMMANENIGTVTTDWNNLTSRGSAVAQQMFTGSSTSRLLKISVNVDKNSKTIKLIPMAQEQQSTAFSSGTGSDVTMNSEELAFVNKIVDQIAAMCGLPQGAFKVYTQEY